MNEIIRSSLEEKAQQFVVLKLHVLVWAQYLNIISCLFQSLFSSRLVYKNKENI